MIKKFEIPSIKKRSYHTFGCKDLGNVAHIQLGTSCRAYPFMYAVLLACIKAIMLWRSLRQDVCYVMLTVATMMPWVIIGDHNNVPQSCA